MEAAAAASLIVAALERAFPGEHVERSPSDVMALDFAIGTLGKQTKLRVYDNLIASLPNLASFYEPMDLDGVFDQIRTADGGTVIWASEGDVRIEASGSSTLTPDP